MSGQEAFFGMLAMILCAGLAFEVGFGLFVLAKMVGLI